MGNEISLTDQILKSNAEFYHAFEMLSIDKMDNLWKHDENVICVHHGWEILVGWLAIREKQRYDESSLQISFLNKSSIMGVCF